MSSGLMVELEISLSYVPAHLYCPHSTSDQLRRLSHSKRKHNEQEEGNENNNRNPEKTTRRIFGGGSQ